MIGGYRAVPDHARLGQIEAFVELRSAGATQVDDIESTVSGLTEVIEAFTTAGNPDALVRVRATDLDQPQTRHRPHPPQRQGHRHQTLIVPGNTRGTA